jgi:hypothetical protein
MLYIMLLDYAKKNIHISVKITQVKACSLPQLPRYKELVSNLSPIHARLSCEKALAKRHPIYKCNEVQVLFCSTIWIYHLPISCFSRGKLSLNLIMHK